MPFNGSGVFNRLYSWTNDAASNIKIRADRSDNEDNGFAVGLSTCITKDGQTTVTANLPMAGFRHTGVGAALDRAHYARFSQVQDGVSAWADGGGTADAITAAYSIPITTLVDGQLCFVRATAANATTTPTFSPDSLTARTIVKQGGSALSAGDISGDGAELILRYDLANTRWELLNPKGTSIPFVAASASVPASLDFAEDTDNGTNKITLKAPASIASDADVTLPPSGVLLSTAAPVTVGQGGTGLATLTANNVILGNGTSTPNFVAPGTSGNVLTSNGTTWTSSSSPGVFTVSYTSPDQTITSAGTLTLAHGMGVVPKFITAQLICQTGEFGFTAGDVVGIYLTSSGVGSSSQGAAIVSDTTNLNVRFSSNGSVYSVEDFTNGNNANLTNGNWKVRFQAFA